MEHDKQYCRCSDCIYWRVEKWAKPKIEHNQSPMSERAKRLLAMLEGAIGVQADVKTRIHKELTDYIIQLEEGY